jgi:hypothetical protein
VSPDCFGWCEAKDELWVRLSNSYHAAEWCNPSATWTCEESFTAVGSVQSVRESPGNTYYLSNAGLLTFRIIMTSQVLHQAHVGNPDWFFPGWNTPGESWRGLCLALGPGPL